MARPENSSKRLLLVGATASLAPEVAQLAHERGYQVTGTSRQKKSNSEFIADWLDLDLSEQSSIEDFAKALDGNYFDLIVFMVGATNPKKDLIEKYIHTYFTNTILLFEILVDTQCIESPSVFINVSSRAAIFPSFDFYYSAVKAGLAASLRSLSKRAHADSKILSVTPGLIIGSTMYNEMSSETKKSHYARSENGLMTIQEFAKEVFEVIENSSKFSNGELIKIGPTY